MKRCFKCGRSKALSEFYPHKKMADGHLNKCKACTKRDVAEHREANLDRLRQYDCDRFQTPERKARVKEYQYRMRNRHPEKYAARAAVARAIRSGRLTRKPCEVCKEPRSEAHHDDYSRPLDVRWLCRTHHRKEHGQLKDVA